MEMVLKLHDKQPEEWFGLQQEFQNQNIGFGRLDKLADHGLQAQETHLTKPDFLAKVQQECAAGRHPIFSLPNLGYTRLIDGGAGGIGEWHIWMAVLDGGKTCGVSKAFMRSSALCIPNLEQVLDRAIAFEPNYRVHVVTYQ